jgi:hypothetical protein
MIGHETHEGMTHAKKEGALPGFRVFMFFVVAVR